jgi:hypothetical protein
MGAIMIFIKLAAQKSADFTIDGEHVDWVGVPFSYDENDPAKRAELVRHNRGVWRIGRRAHGEQYVAFTFNSRVICVAEISDTKTFQGNEDRSYFVCKPLGPGSPVYDKWIGKTQPTALRSRNPISYWDDFEVEESAQWSWKKDGEILAIIDKIAAEQSTRENLINVLEDVGK